MDLEVYLCSDRKGNFIDYWAFYYYLLVLFEK
jgi:hypothetical protein